MSVEEALDQYKRSLQADGICESNLRASFTRFLNFANEHNEQDLAAAARLFRVSREQVRAAGVRLEVARGGKE